MVYPGVCPMVYTRIFLPIEYEKEVYMKKAVHKPPSRIKYDASHPTVSIRVSRQLYDKLRKLREMSGKTLGDILREALKSQKPSAVGPYYRGYNTAKAKYEVTFNCSVCGESVIIDNPDTKKAIARYMTQQGWGHAKCVGSSLFYGCMLGFANLR